jgi:hypothetical protein
MKFERDKRAEKYHLPMGKKKPFEGEGEYTPPYTVKISSGGYFFIHTEDNILCLYAEEALLLYKNLNKAIKQLKKQDEEIKRKKEKKASE